MILNEKQFCALAKNRRLKIKAPMSSLHNFCGIMTWTESTDKQKNVICTIEPKIEAFKDNYFKLYLLAEDKRYGKDEWYLEDLLDFINDGKIECIIK